MLNVREIVDYGSCYVVAINCPAGGIDLPRKATLFDVCEDGTHQTLDTFRTARQAKKFAHRYIADPEGTIAKQCMLSGDRLTHVRALWAVSLLSSWIEYKLTIIDKHNPQAEPKYYEASEVSVNHLENEIIIRYYVEDEIEARFLCISGIKAVRAIVESTFEFETYNGRVYKIEGIC